MKPIRLNDAITLANMEALLSGSDVACVSMPAAVFERACRIRAIHNIKLGDALHLAAAVENGCDLFLTNDHRLSGFPDIRVEVLK